MGFTQEFENKMKDLLGNDAEKFFESLSQPIKKAITVNFNRMSKTEFENIANFEFRPVPEVYNGYICPDLKTGKHILSHLGVIYSQEPSAMYPVTMLDIKKGDIVLDLCSAPGGKSIQILESLNGTGLLVSNEIVYNRAKVLYENLTRMGFGNFAITCNSPQDYKETSILFDKILVDAPCGGEGMFRRDDFDFDSYNNSSIETNAKRQQSILESIKHLLKPNGKLVYSTCTYDIRENEMVVAEFLKNNPDFELLDCPQLNQVTTQGIDIPPHETHKCKRRYPHLFEGEGQFMALLQKKGTPSEEIEEDFDAKGFRGVYRKDLQELQKSFNNIADIKDIEIVRREDNFYALPTTTIDFENLNVVTIGVLLGTMNKGNFKIAHNMYHCLGHLFYNHIELNNEETLKYLQGYEIETDSTATGICVATHHNIALGGGKIVNGKIKNYYPQNLRI
ncbi:MAG: hypothetical protein IJW59_01345 [Clostridia bacterium]|nr:hypothetical protein [Clostridia bacterium]